MSLLNRAALWSLALALAFAPLTAEAQTKKVAAPSNTVNQTAVAYGAVGETAVGVNASNPLPMTCVSGCTATGAGVANEVAPTRTEGESYPLSYDLTGALRVTGISGGGGAGTEFAEDAAHSSGALGGLALGVRKDTAASLAGADGDYTANIYDSSGRLHVNVGNTSLAVTGTFYQATQPVSAASLPLPSGAATSSLQTSGNSSLTTIASNTSGLATASAQTTGNASLAAIDADLGASADLACATDDGSCTVRALIKRTNVLLTAINSSTSTITTTLVDSSGADITDTTNDALRVNCITGCSGGGGAGTEFAEDAAHSSGALGGLALGVRADSAASLAGTDGDYTGMIFDSTGRLWVNSSLPTGAATLVGQTDVQAPATAGAATATKSQLMGATHLSTRPTLTNTQQTQLYTDTRGNLGTTILFPDTATGTAGFVDNADDIAVNSNARNLGVSAVIRLFDGSTQDRARGDAGGLLTQPHALTGSRWQYAAAASGISNTTTAVTIAAAAGASVRNYITGLQIDSDALGAATEIAIRDGAGGTVLWRGKITTAGWINGREIVFPVPLKGTANTLLEVVTLTATTTGAVYVNAQGFTAP